MQPSSGEVRRAAWERRAEWPLLIAALVFLVGYAWPILDPDLGVRGRLACEAATWTAWALFAVDYGARLALAPQRWQFIRGNLFDLAVIVLPLFRPLRLLRLVTLVRVLNRQTSMALRGRVAVYITASSTLLVLCAALAVLDAEQKSPDANITTFPDALWWATTTVTTVGYGDRFPTTTEGRWVAAGLMLAGIALLGLVTATLAHWFVDQVRHSEETTQSEVEDLVREVTRLREQIEVLTAHHTSGNGKAPTAVAQAGDGDEPTPAARPG
jgi:voltage-gated potassium channel